LTEKCSLDGATFRLYESRRGEKNGSVFIHIVVYYSYLYLFMLQCENVRVHREGDERECGN
jgi:hypothetical protein